MFIMNIGRILRTASIMGLLLNFSIALADPTPTVGSFTISSSSVGSRVVDSFGNGVYINANGSICIARLDDCTQLTQCAGIPLAADAAVSLNYRTDPTGQWCGILKSGSTPVTGGWNKW